MPVVSTLYKEFKFGQWINAQRTTKKKNLMSPERVATLEAVPGWSWDPFAATWDTSYNKLRAYFKEHQEMPAYSTLYQGCKLGLWINRQRTAKKKNIMTPERVASLEAIPGWSWDPLSAAWDSAYNLLCAYVEEHEKMPVHSTRYQGCKLGSWIRKQRVTKKKNTISPERQALLESIPGWWW